MAFDHIVFPLMVERGTSSLEFNTTIIPTGSGSEQRIGNWLDARVIFNAGMGVRSRQDIVTLIKFFRARKGRLRGFLVKDLLDYAASGDAVGVGDGTTKDFQLQRVYSDVSTSVIYGATGNTDNRPIFKPIAGTVNVYKGVTLQVQGGYGAYATATISGGVITAVTLTNGGVGYTSNPTVVVSGGGGTGAVITATATAGAVNSSFTISNGGTGYTSVPTISILSSNGDYSINYKTGMLSFNVAPINGTVVSWSGEFYIPCRFSEDALPADEIFYDYVENKAAGGIPDILILETRDYL